MYKVSVIIPMYNVEKYLRECLDSIVSQTLKEIEVICVDDGSPDSSADIAAEYVKKYSNFKLLRKANGGQSSARNAALKIAKGEYVYFLDSDDYIDSQTLEESYQIAESNNLDIVFFNTVAFFENEVTRKKNRSFVDYYTRHGDYSEVCTGQTMFAKMRKNNEFFVSPCLEIFRRKLIETNGICFQEGIIHEDNLFTFQCIMLASRCGYINKAYYHRRVHDDSTMTRAKSIRNVEGYIVCYSEALNFLHGVEIQEAVAASISDFLNNSLFAAACNIWEGLDESEKSKSLSHGGVCADILFSNVRNTVNMKRQLELAKASGSGKVGWFFGKIAGFFRCTYQHGLRYTIHRTFQKAGVVLGRYCPLIKCAAEHGWKYTIRLGGRKIRIAFHKLPLLVKKPLCKLRVKVSAGKPLVSFILPVYNVEKYLPKCLDSLIQQTLSQIEIICVDDGSTDRSLETLNEYAAKDNRIRVFNQKNQYAGVARNLGLSKATGEYVAFLDSDDFFSADLAMETYCAAKIYRADAVIFGAKHFDNSTNQYKEAPWLFREEYVPVKQPFSPVDCPNHLYQITTPCPWTKLFRREFILETGLQFQALRNSNDVFFIYSALALAKRITTVNKSLVFYRVGMANNLQATKKKNPLCFYEAYKALHAKLKETGSLDILRQSYVNTVLSGCLYNLQTQSDPDAKQLVYDALKNEGLEELELTGYEKQYYYNRAYYDELTKIMSAEYDYAYFSKLSRQFYQLALKKWYQKKTGRRLNLEHPTTYNDKINWIKLNEHDPRKTEYSDKYAVRAYVEQRIGREYLVPLLGVWEDAKGIDFDTLPDRFVLKATHGSGWNLIVSDKAALDIPEAVKKLNWWMMRKLSFCNGLELHYEGIKPRIIAEQYLENGDGELNDYKVWCFGGKAHFIQYLSERHHGLKMAFFDLKWNKLPFITNHEQLEKPVEKPDNLEELIAISEKLAAGFNHVRVDFYRLNTGEWKFGEMTFTPGGGRLMWDPIEYDEIVGSLFDIENADDNRDK